MIQGRRQKAFDSRIDALALVKNAIDTIEMSSIPLTHERVFLMRALRKAQDELIEAPLVPENAHDFGDLWRIVNKHAEDRGYDVPGTERHFK